MNIYEYFCKDLTKRNKDRRWVRWHSFVNLFVAVVVLFYGTFRRTFCNDLCCKFLMCLWTLKKSYQRYVHIYTSSSDESRLLNGCVCVHLCVMLSLCRCMTINHPASCPRPSVHPPCSVHFTPIWFVGVEICISLDIFRLWAAVASSLFWLLRYVYAAAGNTAIWHGIRYWQWYLCVYFLWGHVRDCVFQW